MEKGYQLQQWEFIERLGAGGMAEVWKARHVHLDEFAAIKFLLPEYAANSEVQARFLREGRSQFRLRHPNIVKTSDFITRDDRHFLVMEYIEGQSLEDMVLDAGALPIGRALELALPILNALGHAHENGIVHRDVKPSNILLDENGKPHLTDFGIAKALRDQTGSARSMTATSVVMGSVHYMSPEQIQKPSEVDERSDIYSFGCVLYELLTGQPPFDSAEAGGETDFEIQRQHVFEAVRPMRELNPAIPANLEAAVLCALEKEKTRRFASCKAMATALQGSVAESVPLGGVLPEPRLDAQVQPQPGPRTTPRSKTIAESSPGLADSRRGSSSGARQKTQLEGTPRITPAPPAGHQRDETKYGGIPVKIEPARGPKRWLTAVGLVLLAGVLGFAGYRLVDSYRADDPAPSKTEVPNPPDEPETPSAGPEDQQPAELQQAELERQRQDQLAELERQRQEQQTAFERQKREQEATLAKERLAAEQERERQAELERQRVAADLDRERQALKDKEAELLRQQQIIEQERLAELQRKRDEDAKQKQVALKKTTPVRPPPIQAPPRGSFRWQLDLREGETALIRFRPDGGVEYISGGRFVNGTPLYGVQAEVRLSNDASKRFEVSQPLLPSTGYRQLELKCKRGRCKETVEIIWTRN